MIQTQKVLGQSNLVATTLTDIYTVPASTSAVISTITLCNTNTSACAVRVSVAKAGAVDILAQYVLYDQAVDSKSTYVLTIGMTLAAGDVVRCQSTLAGTSVNIFGIEVA